MTKVLLITSIPTPYRVPLFNEINRQLRELGIAFKVLFGARGYARRKWLAEESAFEFEYQFAPLIKRIALQIPYQFCSFLEEKIEIRIRYENCK